MALLCGGGTTEADEAAGAARSADGNAPVEMKTLLIICVAGTIACLCLLAILACVVRRKLSREME